MILPVIVKVVRKVEAKRIEESYHSKSDATIEGFIFIDIHVIKLPVLIG